VEFCDGCGQGLSGTAPARGALQSIEQHQTLLLKSLPVAVYTAEPFSPFGATWISESVRRFSGFAPGDFVGKPEFWASRLHPDDCERVLRTTEAILTHDVLTSEYRWQCANGSYRWLLDQAMLIRDESGKPKEITGTWLDITEHKRAKEELIVAEAKYEDLYENAPDMFVSVEPSNGKIIRCNQTFAATVGYTKEEIIGRPVFEMYHPDCMEEVRKVYRWFVETGEVHGAELQLKRKDGRTIEVSLNASAIRDEQGKTLRSRSTLRDVSDRNRAEKALRESEERYRRLAENAYDLIAEVDHEGRFVYVSPNYREGLGYEPENLLGKICFEFVHPDDLEAAQRAFQNMIPSQPIAVRPVRFRHQDGSWRWMENAGSTFATASGEVRTVAISRDITERKRAEDALRKNEERYRLLAENAGDLVAELNTEGLYEYVSPSYQTVLGYAPDELLGRSPFERMHPDDRERMRATVERIVASGIPETPIYRSRRRDGEWRWLEGYGRALTTASGDTHLLVVIRDITERRRVEEEQRRLEAQMQQTQKLESLGVLAGGIAHDFNNLLVPILGNAHLAEAELAPDSPARRFIERVKTVALRASGLTNALLAYAGRGKLATQHLDICQLLREMGELLHTAISRKTEIRYDFPDSLPPIEGDPAQLRQVILNLITNASEAFGDEAGVVTVGAGTIDADRRYLSETHLGSGLPEGSYVYLDVGDTGCGMDEETRAKIFDPFFTTKFAGRGLGLAALVGIVRAHRGTLKVDSEPGWGTGFRLLFPCLAGLRADVAAEVTHSREWRGSGTILVVDDEEVVREILEEVIPRYGMSVVTAKDGREAVEQFREHAGEIAAVLLDVTMPKLGGEEAFLEIRKIQRDARVILSSGYSEEDFAKHFAGEEVNGFLHKPYQPEELIEKLRQVLES
jgi:PAS domain S-box-containing protein